MKLTTNNLRTALSSCRRGFASRPLLWSMGLVGLLSAGAVGVPSMLDRFSSGETENPNLLTEVVRRGPFRIAVTERGQLDSLRNATLVSNVEGTTTIISIVPAGTHVKAGDLVCELDSSALVEKEKQQRILVTQASAELKKAEENVEIQRRQNESDVAAAELAKELAKLDHEKYKEGEAKQLENELRGAADVAREELTRAEEVYEFTKRLARKGYKGQNDLEADRIAVAKARTNLAVAEDKLRVHVEFTARRTLRELEELEAETARALERVKRQGIATLTQFEADLQARKLTFEVETNKLERLQAQIEACKLRAPQDGQVVYANSTSRREEVIIEEGATVRERQEIVKLPDLTAMKVDARIHESKISLVHVGLPAVVRVDAVPDQVFYGVVHTVSSVPLPGDWRRGSDLKEYEAVVRIEEPDLDKIRQLKPGLTAGIEIIVSERDDVLQVPMQAVVQVRDRYVAFAVQNGKASLRQVLLGESNDMMIEIVDGLEEGERVALNPRTYFAEQLTVFEESLPPAAEREIQPAMPSDEPHQGPASPGAVPPGTTPELAQKGTPAAKPGQAFDPTVAFARFDKNGDGRLTPDELPGRMQEQFPTFDLNTDGSLDAAEWSKLPPRRPGPRPVAETTGGS